MRAGRWISAAALLASGAGAGWLGARRAEGAGAPAPVSIQTAPVEPRDLGATVLATGVIRPRVGAQVAVGSRASGVVNRLHVTVGDRVVAGQLLAELGPVEFETQVARAEAAKASATSDRVWAERQHERARQLAKSGGIATADLDQAERNLETSRAKEREATAALDAARVQLSYTRIHAPIGGVVGTVSTQEGETVAASFAAPTFLTIVDLGRLEVQAYVDETDIGRIVVGQRATFTVDTWPDETFEGRVTAVRPTAELRDNVVNYVTLIEFRNRTDRLLRPEMTATINVVVEGRRNALSVPNGALRREAGGTYVLVESRGAVERRPVTAGLRGSAFTEILSGLRQGERVVGSRGAECRNRSTSNEEEGR
ncbi:MAG: efflux RND transporter periplasmic adaptor subunit [Gemmatimonadales bacterium]